MLNIETIMCIQTGASGEEVDTGCEAKDAHDQYLDATFWPQPPPTSATVALGAS